MARIARFEIAGNIHTAINTGEGWHQLEGDLFGQHSAGSPIEVPDKRLSPVEPPAIFCVGLNYRAHAVEVGADLPERPVLFMKTVNTITGHGQDIEIPGQATSEKMDYECELAIIIGKRCKNVSSENALEYVLGYTCANDVSARDWQMEWGGSQWCRGKSFDTFCPLGPELITADELKNPNELEISTLVNGEKLQHSNTSDMIFDVPTLIEFLSASTTLLPGTVILTGTPSGVGVGRKPPIWLKSGDSVTIEIESIGALTNPVVDESL